MAVRIETVAGAKIRVSGDVDELVELSKRACAEGFSMAFSDGTLIRGTYDEIADLCRFELLVDGAGIVTMTSREGIERVDLSWKIEWLNVAPGSGTLRPGGAQQAVDSAQLAFDIEVKEAA